ncbi:MAG: amphi-Trp domain-containing protein [Desulfonauticus sp.]|nr:amphi-Trp domain-containing protein [Desulfonauticus sp.]
MRKDKISVEQVLKLEKVITYLEGLLEGFKAGKIVVEHEGKVMNLKPAELVEVEIEAKQKPDKEKFSLELSWRPELVEDEDPGLKISKEEPKAAQPAEQDTNTCGAKKNTPAKTTTTTGTSTCSAKSTVAKSAQKNNTTTLAKTTTQKK